MRVPNRSAERTQTYLSLPKTRSAKMDKIDMVKLGDKITQGVALKLRWTQYHRAVLVSGAGYRPVHADETMHLEHRSSGPTDVAMMQSTELWDGDHLTALRRFDLARHGCVTVQRQMRARVMILLIITMPTKLSRGSSIIRGIRCTRCAFASRSR